MQVRASTDDLLGDMDGRAIARCIAAGDITAVEAVAAAIERLQAVEPQLNAIVCERFREALQEAAALRGGQSPALFSGVPSLIKDNAHLAGLPTRHGSRGTPGTPSIRDSAITRQFRAAGFIPIGKTALPEFGLTATTELSYVSPTRNPWNTAYSCGGSSGGAAVLVAAGVVPIAHANDGGGSIRIPAACCGVVGLKPARGRLRSMALARWTPINLVAEGVVSRTVGDTAAFYAEAERHYVAAQLPAIGHVQGPGDERFRIAVSTDHPLGRACNPEVVSAVESVARCCQELGHQVELLPSPVSGQMWEDFLLYWAGHAATLNYLGRFVFGRHFDRRSLEPITYQLSRHYLGRLWRAPGAIKRLRAFGADYQRLFDRYQLILTPVLSEPPPEIGHLAPDLDFETVSERLRHYTPFTPPQNVTGTPAISLPLGRSAKGLPIGVQFAAALGRERQLLEIAFELERAMPWSYPAAPSGA